MLHAYVERFDVMGGRENILSWDGEVNKACIEIACDSWSNPLGLSLNSSVTSAPTAICVRAKMIKVGMPCPSIEKQSMFISFLAHVAHVVGSSYLLTITQCIYVYIHKVV
jgi:hypothetical protein